MNIHDVKRKTVNRKTAIVGRGGKRGKTSGRGGKGQTARSGHKIRPEMRDIIKKMPKLRGYAFRSHVSKPHVLNIVALEHAFAAKESVTPQTLVAKGLLEIRAGKNPEVKILSLGEITKAIHVSGCLVSAQAKEKIEKAGGSVK